MTQATTKLTTTMSLGCRNWWQSQQQTTTTNSKITSSITRRATACRPLSLQLWYCWLLLSKSLSLSSTFCTRSIISSRKTCTQIDEMFWHFQIRITMPRAARLRPPTPPSRTKKRLFGSDSSMTNRRLVWTAPIHVSTPIIMVHLNEKKKRLTRLTKITLKWISDNPSKISVDLRVEVKKNYSEITKFKCVEKEKKFFSNNWPILCTQHTCCLNLVLCFIFVSPLWKHWIIDWYNREQTHLRSNARSSCNTCHCSLFR